MFRVETTRALRNDWENASRRPTPKRVGMLRREKRGAVVCGSKRGVVRPAQRHRFPAVHVATFALERYECRCGPVLALERSVVPRMHQKALLFETFHRPLLAALLTAVAGLRSERSGELVGPGILVGRRCKRNDPHSGKRQAEAGEHRWVCSCEPKIRVHSVATASLTTSEHPRRLLPARAPRQVARVRRDLELSPQGGGD
jgi:hypothetical protein